MDPSGQDAKDFSRASFGGGLTARFPLPHLGNLIAGSAGIELISMLSETHEFRDAQTGLRVEQQTNQDYFRLYLGPEIGPRGTDSSGRTLVSISHSSTTAFSTDVVVPDDTTGENEIRQSLRSEHRPTVGYDLNTGADLNFGKWFIEGGTRFSKSFNVPQQLGAAP